MTLGFANKEAGPALDKTGPVSPVAVRQKNGNPMRNKVYKYLPFAMIGPFATIGIIWMSEGFRGSALFAGSVIASVLVLVTWVAYVFVQRNPKKDTPVIARIIGMSYLIAIGTVAILTLADKLFIIAVVLAPVFATPTIISFAPFWAVMLREKNAPM